MLMVDSHNVDDGKPVLEKKVRVNSVIKSNIFPPTLHFALDRKVLQKWS